MNPLSAVLFWAVTFALWGVGRLLVTGRRRVLADRQHPLRALGRVVERNR